MAPKKFFFVEEARLFVDYIQEMKSHPIKSSRFFYQSELNKQKAEFEQLQV